MFEPKSVLITGGCGFIGSNFLNYIFNKWPNSIIVNFDKLAEGSFKENVTSEIRSSNRYSIVVGNLLNKEQIFKTLFLYKIDTIVHFAALTHVDDSYADRIGTIYENVMSTTNLLEAVIEYGGIQRFLYISTDEVYGDSEENEEQKNERAPLNPTNPYAASKAAAENIIRCYYHSYKLPYVMVRMNNVFGPNQYETKLIPKFIKLAFYGQPYTLRSDGSHTRNWIFVDDCAEAIKRTIESGRIGEIYNIGSEYEYSNFEVMCFIHKYVAGYLGRKPGPIKLRQIQDRPYHDRRYYIDFSKIAKEFGWKCKTSFEEGLLKTIDHTLKNMKKEKFNE
uniref:dTDP-D-glucose 4,6-dehydratase n=1 Tax=Acrobeloides nanus TaxID=290746 RepID=A0A914DG27_9BILA